MRVSKSQLRFAGGLLAGATLFAAVGWWPMVRDIRQIESQIAQAETDLGLTRGRTDGLAQLAMRVEDLRAQSAMNNKEIPQSAEMAGVLRQLSVQIEHASLTGQGISTLESRQREEVIELPVELTFSGQSQLVFGFVERIENMPRLIHVDSLRIARDATQKGQVNASVKLRTFFSPEQEANR